MKARGNGGDYLAEASGSEAKEFAEEFRGGTSVAEAFTEGMAGSIFFIAATLKRMVSAASCPPFENRKEWGTLFTFLLSVPESASHDSFLEQCAFAGSGMIVIVMGVVGSGKTTVGQLLAGEIGFEFVDADDLHPAANIEKMRQGVPLNDEDRRPWLVRLHEMILQWDAARRDVILACSALKRSYRDLLSAGVGVQFVYLRADRELMAERLRQRHGHFATEKILAGQFADLEEPKDAVVVGVQRDPREIVAEIRSRLGS